jgi:LysR family nitrogen assimilation transcriptional regulator
VARPLAETILREKPENTLWIYEGINKSVRIWMEHGLVDAAVMVSTERAPDTFAATPLLHEGLMLVGDRKAGRRLDAPAALSRLGAAQLIQPGRPNVISAQVEIVLRNGAVSG